MVVSPATSDRSRELASPPRNEAAEVPAAAIQAAIDESTQRNLVIAAWILGAAYLSFAAMHAQTLPSGSGSGVLALTITSAAWFFGFASVHRKAVPSPRAAVIWAGIFAYVVLANVTAHYVAMGEVLHGYNFVALQLGVGALISSRRWVIAILASVLAAAFTSTALAIEDPNWGLVIGGLSAFTVVAFGVHVVRTRSERQLVILRFGSEARERQAETALAVARTAQAMLLQAQGNLREIIEKGPDAVVVHRAGAIVYANPTFARWLHWPTIDELVGTPLAELVGPQHQQELARALEVGTTSPRELTFLRHDGEAVVLELAAPQVIEFDGSQAMLLVARDVTARHSEVHARALLADRLAAVGTLVAGVAHEINNPLAFVLPNLRGLADELTRTSEALSSERRAAMNELLRDAIVGAERVEVIVADLVRIARDEHAHTSVVALGSVLESTLEIAENQLRQRATIVTQLEPVPNVVANPGRLGQVFLNLLVNAAQAIRAGDADGNQIRVSTRVGRDGRAVVEIADTGCGMSAETERRLFEPFYTTKPAGVGTGLGLFFCHRVVHELGGQISFDTVLGQGTTFRIELPAAPANLALAPTPAPAQSHAPVPRLRVLVIDDEPLVGRSLKRMLGQEHDVSIATSGEGALAVLRRESFDLVLCDLMIPDLPGYAIHEQLRASDPALARRLVFVTGGAFTDRARQFLEEMDGRVLHKPFDRAALQRVIERAAAARS